MSKSIEQKVTELLESALGVKAPARDQAFCLLPGWDSLRHAEFIIALQKEFKLKFSPSEIAKLCDLNAVYRIIGRGSD